MQVSVPTFFDRIKQSCPETIREACTYLEEKVSNAYRKIFNVTHSEPARQLYTDALHKGKAITSFGLDVGCIIISLIAAPIIMNRIGHVTFLILDGVEEHSRVHQQKDIANIFELCFVEFFVGAVMLPMIFSSCVLVYKYGDKVSKPLKERGRLLLADYEKWQEKQQLVAAHSSHREDFLEGLSPAASKQRYFINEVAPKLMVSSCKIVLIATLITLSNHLGHSFLNSTADENHQHIHQQHHVMSAVIIDTSMGGFLMILTGAASAGVYLLGKKVGKFFQLK